MGDDHENVVMAWIRRSHDSKHAMVVLCNLTPAVRHNHRIGVPAPGYYAEIFNSDGTWYGGTGVGNRGGVYSLPQPAHGRDWSVSLTLPPLGLMLLRIVTATADSPPTEG